MAVIAADPGSYRGPVVLTDASPSTSNSTADGAVTITGRYAAPFELGTGVEAVLLPAAGGDDIFVAELAADGSLVRTTHAGTGGDDRVAAIASLEDGSIWLVGSFSGTLTFGAAQPGAASVTSAGGYDAYIVRFAP